MPERVTCECETIHEDAVREVKAGLSSRDEYIALASLFKMFGDGTRVEILHALELHEMCVCDLAALLGVTKSAISHQLKALAERVLYAGGRSREADPRHRIRPSAGRMKTGG